MGVMFGVEEGVTLDVGAAVGVEDGVGVGVVRWHSKDNLLTKMSLLPPELAWYGFTVGKSEEPVNPVR